MAAGRCLASNIEVASTLERSRQLQQETREAQAASVPLSGIADVSSCLAPLRDAAARGAGLVALHPRQISALAQMLEAVLRLRTAALAEPYSQPTNGAAASHAIQRSNDASETSQDGGATGAAVAFPALAQHAQRISPRLQKLLDLITSRMDIPSSSLKDETNEDLALARAERRQNGAKLAAEMKKWCMELFKQGASQVKTPLVRRGRQCCSVKRGLSGVRFCMCLC